MNIVFRVDGSPEIGMGHISRCLSIGLQFIDMGHNVVFLVSNDFAVQLFQETGIQYYMLSIKNAYKADEVLAVKQYVNLINPSLIIVDSYIADDEYLTAIDTLTPTVYIDGLYKCNANISGVINYNAAANLEEYKERFKNKKTKLFIGLEYVPIKSAFKTARQQKSNCYNNKHPYRILLTTGATDHYNVIEHICKHCMHSEKKQYEYYVVLGKGYDDPQRIRTLALENRCIHVFHDLSVENMAKLMLNADVAISAAGTTVFELLCVGVPTVVFGTVDIHLSFERLVPAIVWCGDIRTDIEERFDRKIKGLFYTAIDLCEDYEHRYILSQRAVSCIDGDGTKRLCSELRLLPSNGDI